MTTEKLTMHALKQHDHIHPSFKASTSTMPQKELPRQASRSEIDGPQTQTQPTRRRTRMTSTSDSLSTKSCSSPSRPKMSIFRFVTATHAWHRLAAKNSKTRVGGKLTPKLENTYKMEPDDRKKFLPCKVEKLLEEVLESRLHDVRYNALTCREMSTDIASYIKARVKAMNFPRYKIVINLIILENRGQGAEVASRCVWDSRSDSFATYTYTNQSLVAIAYVHAIYYE